MLTVTFRDPPRRGERGATLFVVLITLVGLTILGSAGLVLSKTGIEHSENVEAGMEAFYAADEGLLRYAGDPSSTGAAAATYTIGQANVMVTPTQVADMGPRRAMYRLRSVATHTDSDGRTTSRAVSAMAIYSEGDIKVKGAFTSGTGILKNGGSGEINGNDQAPGGDPACPDSPGDAVAGVAVPTAGYTQDGGTSVPQGDPDIGEYTQAELMEEIGIDWAGVIDDGLQAADYLVPPDSWPNFGSLPADEWPVIMVDANHVVDAGDSGRGTLIVTGNLEMNGTFAWDGILLVGGYVTSNGYQTIRGATVTSLNTTLGDVVPSSDIGNGNKKFLYDSCMVKQASKAAFGGLALVPGSWTEDG